MEATPFPLIVPPAQQPRWLKEQAPCEVVTEVRTTLTDTAMDGTPLKDGTVQAGPGHRRKVTRSGTEKPPPPGRV
ncbi:hypothetical protein [Streptomyces sp. NPDC053367]|uniref:hypothetical protein n=1 Tax=Streptomyces sp. NPDC053367 TaxID=3365700 RepID=UPI0037D401A6